MECSLAGITLPLGPCTSCFKVCRDMHSKALCRPVLTIGLTAALLATGQADRAEATMFSLNVKASTEEQVAAAKNAIKRMKMLRHPNFVK